MTDKSKKPIVEAYTKGSPEKFGVQTEISKVVIVFPNGDKNHLGHQMVIHSKKYKSFDQVKQAMTKQPGVATGAVHQIFTPTEPNVFRKVKGVEDFENNGIYICCGGENVDKTRISAKFLELQEKKFNGEQPTPSPNSNSVLNTKSDD